MGESKNNNQLYHFSKKVLFLSVLFLLINIAWYVLVLYSERMVDFREVAPRLVFAKNQEVALKTPFDKAYFLAQPDQILITGAQVKTGDQSFAEIQLEENVVRLDQNTELKLLENNFQNPTQPRFVFELFSGNVWVNAFDPIIVITPQSQAYFSHTVGFYSYSDPLNRVMSVIGNVDLNLLGENGHVLSQFVVPLKSQVTFTDPQIVPEYARLEYSKLKKELKMGPVFQTALEEEWVKRNTLDDEALFLAGNQYIFSPTVYRLKNIYHALREKLAFIPHQKRLGRLNRANIKLQYLLGGIHENNLNNEAEKLLKEFDGLIKPFANDPALRDLIERQFYAIRNVKTDTPAYLLKENLRGHLFSEESPELLRSYLADLDFLMRVEETAQAEKAVEAWLKKWNTDMRKAELIEFEKQARIFHSILLAYADQVNTGLLGALDEVGDFRIEHAKNPEETILEIALERLEMSKYLVAAYRYTDAKTYLKTSYAKLNLAEREISEAARKIFLEDASLLAERIAFAEQTLKGAAEFVDEEEFLEYLSIQERDKILTERFVSFLDEIQAPEEMAYPTIDDVSQKFTLARIVVLDEDIEINTDFPFEFHIKYARLLDRAEDGSLITFSARFDYSTNAVYDIVLNDMPLKGNFVLEDFILIAKTGEMEVAVEPKIDTLEELLGITESEEAERSQVIAQDLAVQLMIKELEEFNILVSGAQQVTVLNPATLNEFRIVDVYIEDPERTRPIKVSFDYNSVTKTISNVQFEDMVLDIPSQIQAEQFISVVLSTLHGKEQEIKSVRDVVSELNNQNLLIEAADFHFINNNFIQIEFRKIRIKNMPVEFSGIYDRMNRIFLRAEHTLLTLENTPVNDYLARLSKLWVIDYLANKGIEISEENIMSKLPASRVSIKNYARGDKILDFTFDVASNRLIDIVLQGTDAKVDSMTFEEFSLIE